MKSIDGNRENLVRLGEVALLMCRSRLYCQYPVACISEWLIPPIALDQILVFRNASGLLVGYVTWALLTEDVETRWLNDPNVLLHFSEWNEGDRLWIMDFVSTQGRARDLVQQARQHLAQHGIAKSLRRDDDGRVRKIVTWKAPNHVAGSR